MNKISPIFILSLLFVLWSCSVESPLGMAEAADSGAGEEGSGSGNNTQAGLITAGEWNDLDNWDFWNGLMNGQDHSGKPGYWEVYLDNRISVEIANNGSPVQDLQVELRQGSYVIWKTRTDNLGKAELWINPYQAGGDISLGDYTLYVNGEPMGKDLKSYTEGVNRIEWSTTGNPSNKVDLAFIVDATGSMGDELEFLKKDLEDVILSVQSEDQSKEIRTGTVFYRDQGDDYVTRKSDFTPDLSNTIGFIREQQAGGGGDFPEAVHTALDRAVNELEWSQDARTRIAFLLLDAPPHHNTQVLDDLQANIQKAAEKGIKVIPITASGINKETEFLMRFMAIATNGTYVFITNDSGIGNDHLEPTVGEYQVEFLNELMVRLINKYSE